MVESPASNPQDEKRTILSDLLLWLALIPLILATLICSSQLGMLIMRSNPSGDTASRLKADYAPWEYQVIPQINIKAFLGDVEKEAAFLGTPTPAPIQTGVYWVPPTGTLEVAVVNTNTPTVPVPPANETSTPTRPAQRTPTRATPTKTFASITKAPPTLTLTVQPTHTITIAPTTTKTRTVTPQPQNTFTFTPQPQIPATRTRTSTSTSTSVPPTPTFTHTPVKIVPTLTPVTPSPEDPPTSTPVTPTVTPTYAPVRPIAENNGLSEIVPDGCKAYFGYRNDNPYEVYIPLGPRNTINVESVSIKPEQTTQFLVDRKIGSFEIVWSNPGPIIWTLDGRSATANWCQP